jgi:hypothetical protein
VPRLRRQRVSGVDGPSVRKKRTQVVEDDDPVAQLAPTVGRVVPTRKTCIASISYRFGCLISRPRWSRGRGVGGTDGPYGPMSAGPYMAIPIRRSRSRNVTRGLMVMAIVVISSSGSNEVACGRVRLAVVNLVCRKRTASQE